MNRILKVLTAGSAAMLACGAASATPHVPPFNGDGFGVDNNISLTGTTLSVDCPATATACINYEGGDGSNGMIQRRVVMQDGTSYLQSIIAEGDMEETLFASEQIVRMGVDGGTRSSNIAQKLKIFEAGTGADDYYLAEHTMLGCEHYGTQVGSCGGGTEGGQQLLLGLDQRIHEGQPGNAMDQLTRIVGEITGAAGNLNGNAGAFKRVGIDQWHGTEPGAGNPGAAGTFVYRTGRDTGTEVTLEDPNATPIELSANNIALAIQSRQTGNTGLMFHRVSAGVPVGTGIPTDTLSRTELTGDVSGPWDWNGAGADADGDITAIFGSYTDQTSSALDLWQ